MYLGIARAADTKITAFFQFANELYRMTVMPRRTVGVFHALGNITAQRHNVLNPCRLERGNTLLDRITGRGNAGKMRKGFHSELFLHAPCNIEGIAACTAACAVGNAHKRRRKLRDFFRRRLYAVVYVVRFRGKNLKGQGIGVLFENFGQLHRMPPK